jgi:hypothetical protein
MTLSDLSSIVGVISGLAVLGSLIYLSLQTRQMERNQRATMHQGFSTRDADIALRLAEPNFAHIWNRAFLSEGEFTQTEVAQLINIVRATLLSVEDAYLLRKSRLIDDVMFETSMGQVRSLFSLPIFRAIWPMARGSFSREFSDFFEKWIRSVPLRRQVDLSAQLKINLAKIEAAGA